MMHQPIPPQAPPSSTLPTARRGTPLAALVSAALAFAACGGGGIRQRWSFAPVEVGGVSLSTDAVVVRPQVVNVQIRVHNPTPNRVAINYQNVYLELPNGRSVHSADSLAARMRVARSGGIGGIQYVPPGGGVFRVDFEGGPVDYTTLPSMQLRLAAVLVSQISQSVDVQAGVRTREVSVEGAALNFPPITITPPAAPAPVRVVVATPAPGRN